MFKTKCFFLNYNNAELFTLVCLPNNQGKFPTVIMRSPYVDSDEFLSEEEICQNRSREYKVWLDNGYAVIFSALPWQG